MGILLSVSVGRQAPEGQAAAIDPEAGRSAYFRDLNKYYSVKLSSFAALPPRIASFSLSLNVFVAKT